MTGIDGTSKCKTREITLDEFMNRYMNPKTDERDLECLKDRIGTDVPLLGYLTIYDLGDFAPKLEAVFLFPNRIVRVYNQLASHWFYEPYPNPSTYLIPIDQYTTCELKKSDNLVNVQFTIGKWEQHGGSPTFAPGPEVETFVKVFHLVKDLAVRSTIYNEAVDWNSIVFERCYDIEESIRKFESPKNSLNNTSRTDHSRDTVTQRFTPQQLETWLNSFFTFPGYNNLMRLLGTEMKALIREVPNAYLPGETTYGLLFPIIKKKWAIENAAGVTNGAFAGLAGRFVIYDFKKNTSLSIPYSEVTFVNLRGTSLFITTKNKKYHIKFKLDIGLKFAFSMANLIVGVGSGFSKDPAQRLSGPLIYKPNIEMANSEIREMQNYLETVFKFCVEAINGSSWSREI